MTMFREKIWPRLTHLTLCMAHTTDGAGGNKTGPATTTGISAAKLENETEDFHLEKVSSNLKQQIIQARTAKKMTQIQLAQAINEKPQVIQDYESGESPT